MNAMTHKGRVLFCSLTKGITRKIGWFCLVLINSVLLNLSYVGIMHDIVRHLTISSYVLFNQTKDRTK